MAFVDAMSTAVLSAAAGADRPRELVGKAVEEQGDVSEELMELDDMSEAVHKQAPQQQQPARGTSHASLCTPPSSPSDLLFENTSLPIEFVDAAMAMDNGSLEEVPQPFPLCGRLVIPRPASPEPKATLASGASAGMLSNMTYREAPDAMEVIEELFGAAERGDLMSLTLRERDLPASFWDVKRAAGPHKHKRKRNRGDSPETSPEAPEVPNIVNDVDESQQQKRNKRGRKSKAANPQPCPTSHPAPMWSTATTVDVYGAGGALNLMELPSLADTDVPLELFFPYAADFVAPRSTPIDHRPASCPVALSLGASEDVTMTSSSLDVSSLFDSAGAGRADWRLVPVTPDLADMTKDMDSSLSSIFEADFPEFKL